LLNSLKCPHAYFHTISLLHLLTLFVLKPLWGDFHAQRNTGHPYKYACAPDGHLHSDSLCNGSVQWEPQRLLVLSV